MSEVIVMPDNPMSVMTLFDADKPSLDRFIDYISNTIASGMDDPLKVLAISKKMDYVTEAIRSRIKEQIKAEAQKYGEKPFVFAGTEMHYTATKTEYVYEDCGDPEWNEAALLEARYGYLRKERETFLKALQKPFDIVHKDTGEVITIVPPQKKQVMGVKTTVK